MLSIIAGLQRATEGGVVIKGRQPTEPEGDSAVVFQTPSLLPWLSAKDNDVPFTRPRDRRAVLEQTDYRTSRQAIIDFLENHPRQSRSGDHGIS